MGEKTKSHTVRREKINDKKVFRLKGVRLKVNKLIIYQLVNLIVSEFYVK